MCSIHALRKKQAHATTIRLDPADREALARMRELYGCPSDSAAIKLALRMVARTVGVPTQAPNKERPFYPMSEVRGFTGRLDNS